MNSRHVQCIDFPDQPGNRLCVGDQVQLRVEVESEDLWVAGARRGYLAEAFDPGDVGVVVDILVSDEIEPHGTRTVLTMVDVLMSKTRQGHYVGFSIQDPDELSNLSEYIIDVEVGALGGTPPFAVEYLKAHGVVQPPQRRTSEEAAVEQALDTIQQHRRRIRQPPLDPQAAGWEPADVIAEAARIRRLNPRLSKRRLMR